MVALSRASRNLCLTTYPNVPHVTIQAMRSQVALLACLLLIASTSLVVGDVPENLLTTQELSNQTLVEITHSAHARASTNVGNKLSGAQILNFFKQFGTYLSVTGSILPTYGRNMAIAVSTAFLASMFLNMRLDRMDPLFGDGQLDRTFLKAVWQVIRAALFFLANLGMVTGLTVVAFMFLVKSVAEVRMGGQASRLVTMDRSVNMDGAAYLTSLATHEMYVIINSEADCAVTVASCTALHRHPCAHTTLGSNHPSQCGWCMGGYVSDTPGPGNSPCVASQHTVDSAVCASLNRRVPNNAMYMRDGYCGGCEDGQHTGLSAPARSLCSPNPGCDAAQCTMRNRQGCPSPDEPDVCGPCKAGTESSLKLPSVCLTTAGAQGADCRNLIALKSAVTGEVSGNQACLPQGQPGYCHFKTADSTYVVCDGFGDLDPNDTEDFIACATTYSSSWQTCCHEYTKGDGTSGHKVCAGYRFITPAAATITDLDGSTQLDLCTDVFGSTWLESCDVPTTSLSAARECRLNYNRKDDGNLGLAMGCGDCRAGYYGSAGPTLNADCMSDAYAGTSTYGIVPLSTQQGNSAYWWDHFRIVTAANPRGEAFSATTGATILDYEWAAASWPVRASAFPAWKSRPNTGLQFPVVVEGVVAYTGTVDSSPTIQISVGAALQYTITTRGITQGTARTAVADTDPLFQKIDADDGSWKVTLVLEMPSDGTIANEGDATHCANPVTIKVTSANDQHSLTYNIHHVDRNGRSCYNPDPIRTVYG